MALRLLTLLSATLTVPYAMYERYTDAGCATYSHTEVRRLEECVPLGTVSSYSLHVSTLELSVMMVYYATPNCTGLYTTGLHDSKQSELTYHTSCFGKTRLLSVGNISLDPAKDAILGKYASANCADETLIVGIVYHLDDCILHSSTGSSQRQGWVKGEGIVTYVYPNGYCGGEPWQTHDFLSDKVCMAEKQRMMRVGGFGEGENATTLGTPLKYREPIEVPAVPTKAPTSVAPTVLAPTQPTSAPTKTPTKVGETYAPTTAPTKAPTGSPTSSPTTAWPTHVRIVTPDDHLLLDPARKEAITWASVVAGISGAVICAGVLGFIACFAIMLLKIRKRWEMEDGYSTAEQDAEGDAEFSAPGQLGKVRRTSTVNENPLHGSGIRAVV